MENTALSFFRNKEQLVENLAQKIEQQDVLRGEVEELRKQVDIAERIDEVWDDVPIEISTFETNNSVRLESLDESGVWYRRATISRDKCGEDITKPIYWRIEINQRDIGNADGNRWFLGKKLEIGLKSYEEALDVVREWFLKGTIHGKEVEG